MTSDRLCEPCDGFTEYQNQEMAALCFPISPVCGLGTYQSKDPTPSSDRVCTPCDTGQICDCLTIFACFHDQHSQVRSKMKKTRIVVKMQLYVPLEVSFYEILVVHLIGCAVDVSLV